MTKNEKSSLLNMIGKGDIKSTLEKLLSLEMNDSSKKEVIAISSRYKKLKHQNRLGILSFEQSNLTENQITNHLIDLINHPFEKPFPKDKSINTINPSKPIIWKYITTAAVIIGMLGSLSEILNFTNIFTESNLNEKHQLTVFVTDSKGNVVLEHKGELNTSIGNRPMRETIGQHGRTNFGDILSEYLGDSITVGIKAEGWELINPNNKFVFDGSPIYLKIKKDDSLGIVKGVVRTRDGQNFIEGVKILINADTLVFTNVNGLFQVTLPESMRVNKVTDAYSLTASKEGYKTKSIYFYPKSTNAEIRLEKDK